MQHKMEIDSREVSSTAWYHKNHSAITLGKHFDDGKLYRDINSQRSRLSINDTSPSAHYDKLLHKKIEL